MKLTIRPNMINWLNDGIAQSGDIREDVILPIEKFQKNLSLPGTSKNKICYSMDIPAGPLNNC